MLEKVLELCAKKGMWSLWYDHPDGHATSNMLDRLMRQQNNYFDRGQHFHGSLESADLRSDFAQLLGLGTKDSEIQWRLSLPGGSTQPQAIHRKLARKPARRYLRSTKKKAAT